MTNNNTGKRLNIMSHWRDVNQHHNEVTLRIYQNGYIKKIDNKMDWPEGGDTRTLVDCS